MATSAPARRVELLGLGREELAAALGPHVDRPFRVGQIYDALYRRGETDFDAMTDLARPLRERLAESFSITLPEVTSRQEATDGTTKFLLRLADGASIEAVDIPDRGRRTLCISSQAGCGLGCAFCVTGHWGVGRNLTAGEIVGQVLLLRRIQQLPDSLNLVFMGMGEPLLNLDAVHAALDRLAETISWRRMTVSTAGVVPGVDALASWKQRPNLAVSLHAPDDARRSSIMPINQSYPLGELLAALRRYPLEPRRRITIEYILLAGFNDSVSDAAALARRLRGFRTKVNLIPFNPDPVLGDRFARPDDATVYGFQEALAARGFTATVRRTRGDDVGAACGQLRAFARPPGLVAPPESPSRRSQTSARLRPARAPSRR